MKGEQNSRPHFDGYSSANVSSTCLGDNPSLFSPRSRQSLTHWIHRKDQWKPPSLSLAALGLCRSRITILPLVSSNRPEHSSHCFCCCLFILVCTVCNADYTEKPNTLNSLYEVTNRNTQSLPDFSQILGSLRVFASSPIRQKS